MQIIFSTNMGFCHGVKKAVAKALESGSGSYTLGSLIHNQQMVDKLREKGITKVDSLYGVASGSKVIFRSHGESPTNYAIAQNRNLEVIDVTCDFVKKAQDSGKLLAKEGFEVIIIGDDKHPEVTAIKAWVGNGTKVVRTVQEVEELPSGKKYGVIAQTTCTDDLFATLSKKIEEKAEQVKIINTICSATKQRQQAAIELAKKADTVIVVGSQGSANTTHLAEIAAQYCPKVIFIETKDELDQEMLKGTKVLGITSGASTPDWLVQEIVDKIQGMDMFFNQDGSRKLFLGDIVEGVVVSIRDNIAFVDINHKSEGMLSLQDLSLLPLDDITSLISVDDKINAVIVGIDKDGNAKLSKVKYDALVADEKLKKAQENNEKIEAIVTGVVKGGVSCQVFGINAFIPASHLDLNKVEDLSVFVGKKFLVQIIELDVESQRKKIVLSRREVLKQEKQEHEQSLYAKLKIGEKYSGIVSRLTSFGAFVDLGGVDGLLHVADMAWQKVKNPEDILKLGDKVEVLVQKVDALNKKISLNLRDLQQDPWLVNAEKYQVGQIVQGKVSKIMKFGAFVALDNLVEGLVHVSEISDEHTQNIESVLEIGQEVKVMILAIDKKTKKVSLSIAQAKKEEEKQEFSEFLGDKDEFSNSIGSKFDLTKLFGK